MFADDASKIQRIYDNLGLDYVAAQAGDATVEKAPVQEKQPPAAAPSRMETVQTEHGAVEFEVGGFEDEIELSSVPDQEEGANFTSGREKDLYRGMRQGVRQRIPRPTEVLRPVQPAVSRRLSKSLREKTAAGDPAGAGPEEGGTDQAAPA